MLSIDHEPLAVGSKGAEPPYLHLLRVHGQCCACWSLTQIILTRHADLGPDPKHWPSEGATAANQSDDRGALLACGGRDSGRPFGKVWGAEPPQESFSCEPWEPPVA